MVIEQLLYGLTEAKVLELVNSCDGWFDVNCFAISACCFMYDSNNEGRAKGMAMFTYASPHLANFVVRQLDGLIVQGRRVQAMIADCPVNCDRPYRRIRGFPRWGSAVWDCL